MIAGSEGRTTAGSARDSSDDTIELDLTGEEELALSRAAEAARATARPDESGPVLSVPEYNCAFRATARIDFVCNVLFAMAVPGIAVALLWPAPDRHPPAPAPAFASAAPLLTKVAPAGPAEPQGAPVRIKNAFDATEVFEFPPGTTGSESREGVAELLLRRASDRRAEGLALRHAGNRQPDRGTEIRQPEVLVTRLLARANEP